MHKSRERVCNGCYQRPSPYIFGNRKTWTLRKRCKALCYGRDYIEVRNYLERIIPFLGVRFISVTDENDSMGFGGTEGVLMVPLKNMLNEMYAKDISSKIITSFRVGQERGEYLRELRLTAM